MKLKLFSFLMLSLTILMNSCSEDEVAPKSSESKIISFKFSDFSTEVVGVIDETNKTIDLVVPNGTDVKALVPTITISEKATVFPLSGAAHDFSDKVAYTVTAEDGSTRVYDVHVEINAVPSFTTNSLAITDLQQDNVIIIDGTNFGTDYTLNKVVLKNKSTGAEIVIPVASISTATRLFAFVPADAPLGQYEMTVYKGAESLKSSQTFTIVYHTPEIVSIDKTQAAQSESVVITGKYFMTTGNTVKLNKSGGGSTTVTVTAQSATSITFKVPGSQATGEYTISVISNGKESFYNAQKLTVVLPEGTPVITAVNKFSFARGETITITGTNFRKIGFAANINFMPLGGGVTLVRSGIASDDGTQVTYTIPGNFTTGMYVLVIEVDGLFSEEFRDSIQITP